MLSIESNFNYEKKIFNEESNNVNNNFSKPEDVSIFNSVKDRRTENQTSLEELYSYFMDNDVNKTQIQTKNDSDKLPDGVSRFDYNGAKYTIYKKDSEYKSEYFAPDGTEFDDFIKKFPELPVVQNQPTSSEIRENSLGINGEFDETTIQGKTGDCWVLTALKTLSSTEAGKETIKNSIKVNDDNTVTVTFAGVGVSYTLSADEILEHDTDNNKSDAYSNGDNDVLAFELATEYLLDDINSGKVNLNTQNKNISNVGKDITDGGLPSQMIYFLTGNESNEKYNSDLSNLSKNDIYSMLENMSGNDILTIGIYNNSHSCKLLNGSNYSLNVGNGGHALSVTNVDKNNKTITIVNPWDSSAEYTMSWSEFAKLGIGYMCTSNADSSNAGNNTRHIDVTNYESGKINRSGSDFKKPNHFFNQIGFEHNETEDENSPSSVSDKKLKKEQLDDNQDVQEVENKEQPNFQGKIKNLFNKIFKFLENSNNSNSISLDINYNQKNAEEIYKKLFSISENMNINSIEDIVNSVNNI